MPQYSTLNAFKNYILSIIYCNNLQTKKIKMTKNHIIQLSISTFLRTNKIAFSKDLRMLIEPNISNRAALVFIYKHISQNHSIKNADTIKSLDKLLTKKQQNLSKSMDNPNTNDSIFLKSQRFKALTNWKLYQKQTANELIQYIIASDLTYSQVMIVIKILRQSKNTINNYLQKLKINIEDTINQLIIQFIKKQYPAKVFSLLSFFSKYNYSLQQIKNYQLISTLISNDIFLFNQVLHKKYLTNISINSIKTLILSTMLQNSLVKKHILHKLIVGKLNKTYSSQLLPGNRPISLAQISQSLQYIHFINCDEELFIENLNILVTKYYQQEAQRQPIINLFIQQIHLYIQNNPAVLNSHLSKTIWSIFYKFVSEQFIQTYLFQTINLFIQYLSIITTFRRYYYLTEQQQLLAKTLLTTIQKTYNRTLPLSLFTLSQSLNLKSISNLLLDQCLSHLQYLKTNDQIIHPLLSLESINQSILKLSCFTTNDQQLRFLKEIYIHTKYWHQYTAYQQLNSPLALLHHQIITKPNFKSYLQDQQFHLGLETQMQLYFFQHYYFAKNVCLQPNISIPFAIISIQNKNPVFTFQYHQEGQHSYTFLNRLFINQNQFVNELTDLNLQGLWKKQFLKSIYSSTYLICLSQQQIITKLTKAIRTLSPPTKSAQII